MTFPILASLLVRLVVLLPFQLLRLSLATPSRCTPLALSVFLHCVFFFSSRRRHTRSYGDWSSDVCSSDLDFVAGKLLDLIGVPHNFDTRWDPQRTREIGRASCRERVDIESAVDIFNIYVPHRNVYGEQWIKFMKDGVNATPLQTVNTTGYI